jgi:YD repeat-containing protein
VQNPTTLSTIRYAHGATDMRSFVWNATQNKWLSGAGVSLTQATNGNWVLAQPEGGVEVFDNVGRLVSITNVNGLTWQLAYNPIDNRPQSITHSSGRQFTFAWYPAAGSVFGKLKSVTDSFNRTVSYTYVASGYGTNRLETVTYPNGDVKKYTTVMGVS